MTFRPVMHAAFGEVTVPWNRSPSPAIEMCEEIRTVRVAVAPALVRPSAPAAANTATANPIDFSARTAISAPLHQTRRPVPTAALSNVRPKEYSRRFRGRIGPDKASAYVGGLWPLFLSANRKERHVQVCSEIGCLPRRASHSPPVGSLACRRSQRRLSQQLHQDQHAEFGRAPER